MTLDEEFRIVGRFREQVPAPDDETMRRVYKAATAGTRRARPDRKSLLRWRARRSPLVLAMLASTILILGVASAFAYRMLSSDAPGFTSGFSSFENLPQTAWPASISPHARERFAAVLGLNSRDAEPRLRLLRTGLALAPPDEQGQGRLYALIGPNGGACYFLAGLGGGCLTESNVGPGAPSLLATVSPGYPGQTPAIVGIVADNVRSVSADVGGQIIALDLVNNSIYADLSGLMPDEAIRLLVDYQDGTSRTMSLPNPRNS